MKHFLEASDPSTDSVFSSSCQGFGLPTQAHLMIRKLPLLSWAAFFLFSHTRSGLRTHAAAHTGSPDSLHSHGWFTVLTYFSVLSFLCLCLLEASRCPGLLVRGATGGYRRSGARVLQLLCRSLGYRCAQGQSPTDQLGLRRKWEGTSLPNWKLKQTECLTF